MISKIREIEINGEWFIAVRLMIRDLKSVMKNDKGESYDEEYYIEKLDNILENFNKIIKAKKIKSIFKIGGILDGVVRIIEKNEEIYNKR
jgi:Zn-dependent oligopeptidase